MAGKHITKKAETAIALPPGCVLTATGLTLPKNLSHQKWLNVGTILGRLRSQLRWAFADWWAFGEFKYGARVQLVHDPNWNGPSFQTCMHIGTVARAFETCRRRQVLSFTHHATAASQAPDEADALLQWCIDTGKPNRPRSVADLREEIDRREEIRRRKEIIEAAPNPRPLFPEAMPVTLTIERPAVAPAEAVMVIPVYDTGTGASPEPEPVTDDPRWEIVERALLLGLEIATDEPTASRFREARTALQELRG